MITRKTITITVEGPDEHATNAAMNAMAAMSVALNDNGAGKIRWRMQAHGDYVDDAGNAIDPDEIKAALAVSRHRAAVHAYQPTVGSEPLSLKTRCGQLTISVARVTENLLDVTCPDCLRNFANQVRP